MKAVDLLPLDEIKFNEEVYPRSGEDKNMVNEYKLNLENLPPIIVSKQSHTLIDGFHRWLAYRDEGQREIPVEFIDIPKNEYLLTAIKLNSTHGRQLTIADKRKLAERLRKDDFDVAEIAKLLSVSDSIISKWTWKIEKEKSEKRNQKILELYLACYTEKEIAEKADLSRNRVSEIITKVENSISEKTDIIPDSLQIFNLWDFSICDSRYGRKYPGRMPGQVVENLLYYYTNPFDIVLDPMAGSGTTIDVCIEMNRRYLAYDLQSDPKKIN